MRLSFREIVVENYGSYVGRHKLRFRDLSPGLHYVRGKNYLDAGLGSNDAGKSTLLDALTWCLFGRTTNGLRSTNMEPWLAKGSTTAVSVRLKLDGKRHTVKRTARPNLLTWDGEEISQQDLEHKIGMSFPVFKQTVLFGQKQDLFFDLGNTEKMQLLSEVMRLERWELRSIRASDATKVLEKKLSEWNSELGKIASMRSSLLVTLKAAKVDKEKWHKQHRRDMDELRWQSDEQDTLFRTHARECRNLDDTVEQLAKSLGEMQAQVVIDREAIQAYDHSQTKTYLARTRIEDEISRLSDELAELETQKVCSKCGQKIKSKIDIQAHREKTLSNLKTQRDKLKALPKVSPKPRQKLLDVHTESRVRATSYQAKYDDAKRAADQMHRLKVQAEAKVANAKARLATERDAVNPYVKQVKQLRERLSNLKTERLWYEKRVRRCERKIERTKYWIKGFKEIRLITIEELMTELEIATNQMLEEMGLVGWSVQYAIERETKSGTIQSGIDVLIQNPRRKEPTKWASWGGGVSQRLRLAGSLALSEVLLNHAGIEIDLEILDEPTKHMTEEGVEGVIDVLAARAKALGRRILYVDHMAQDGANFTSTITICKDKKRGSYIQ